MQRDFCTTSDSKPAAFFFDCITQKQRQISVWNKSKHKSFPRSSHLKCPFTCIIEIFLYQVLISVIICYNFQIQNSTYPDSSNSSYVYIIWAGIVPVLLLLLIIWKVILSQLPSLYSEHKRNQCLRKLQEYKELLLYIQHSLQRHNMFNEDQQITTPPSSYQTSTKSQLG